VTLVIWPLANSARGQMTADEIRQLKPLTCRNVLSHFQRGGSVSLQATRAAGKRMFEYVTLSWVWSYGDSNPRPLACHSWAHRPAESKLVALRQVRPGQPSGWVWPEPSRSGCVVTRLVTGPRGAAGAGQAPQLAPPRGPADQGWRPKPHRDAQRGAHRTSTAPAGLHSSSPPVKIREHHRAHEQTRGTPYRGSSGPRLNSSLDGDRHQPPIQALTCRSSDTRVIITDFEFLLS
jgi:hypothetical protein